MPYLFYTSLRKNDVRCRPVHHRRPALHHLFLSSVVAQRRLDILQRPRMLPHGANHGRPQKPTSSATGNHQDVETPTSLPATTDSAPSQQLSSPSAAAAARADDGMAGSSLRAEAETLSLLPGKKLKCSAICPTNLRVL